MEYQYSNYKNIGYQSNDNYIFIDEELENAEEKIEQYFLIKKTRNFIKKDRKQIKNKQGGCKKII